MDVKNSVTPEAAAKQDLLFNEPASGLCLLLSMTRYGYSRASVTFSEPLLTGKAQVRVTSLQYLVQGILKGEVSLNQ
jgi:hypothetical protein